MKKYLPIFLVVLVSLVFRLWLIDKGWHVDMWSNAAWGEWIYNHGTKGFYTNSEWIYSWPTQFPFINSVYAFNKYLFIQILGRVAWFDFQLGKYNIHILSNFVSWFGYGRVNLEIPFQIGYLVVMKLWPILADIAIAIFLYFFGNKKILWSLIFLISPFSWYLSSGWGQYDGVGYCFMLAAFITTNSNLYFLSPILFALSIFIKPTSLLLLPFYLYYFLKQKRNVLLLLLFIPTFFVTTAPFTQRNIIDFSRYDLKRIIFEKSEPRLSVNAFNFYRVFIGDKPLKDKHQVLAIMVFGILNLMGIYYFEFSKGHEEQLWNSLFIISGGSFMFMAGMLDRYAYSGIMFGLIVSIKNANYLKYWIPMSIIFWLNLFYHWWWPNVLSSVKYVLLFNEGMVTNILAFLNVSLFAIWLLESFRKLPFHPILKRKI